MTTDDVAMAEAALAVSSARARIHELQNRVGLTPDAVAVLRTVSTTMRIAEHRLGWATRARDVVDGAERVLAAVESGRRFGRML